MRVFVVVITLLLFLVIVCGARTTNTSSESLKQLPINVNTYTKILSGEYVYVDKTNLILKLIQGSSKFIYLARPSQFGKSLLTSTLEGIFKGKNNKELFKGTAIYRSTYEWTEYPVVRIDFSRIPRNFLKEFLDIVKEELKDQGKLYGITDQSTPNMTDHFLKLIRALNGKFGRPVVVLFEEYDWSPVERFGLPEAANVIVNLMRNFYNAIKSHSEIIRFCFIIAIPELSKASKYSGYDEMGLVDVSSKLDYNEITGFTMDEIKLNFRYHIEAIAADEKVPVENIYEEIKSWYMPYKFSIEGVPVYNPYFILTHLEFKKMSDIFGNRWGQKIDL